jgi:hypothetical protein
MLAYAEPYSRCEDELIRKAHPCAPASAKTLRERLLRHPARRLEEALAQLAGRWVTLAFDGGTIWSRYLAIVALSRVICVYRRNAQHWAEPRHQHTATGTAFNASCVRESRAVDFHSIPVSF